MVTLPCGKEPTLGRDENLRRPRISRSHANQPRRIVSVLTTLTRWCFLIVLLAFVEPQVISQQRLWFTVYYPTWAMRQLGEPFGLPPWEIEWAGISHLVHFHVPVHSNMHPYFGPVVSAQDSVDIEFNGIGNPLCGPKCWTHWQDSLISIAHRHGVKVLLSIDAVDPTEWNIVTADSSKTVALASSAVAYCKRRGYDGLEINVETWLAQVIPTDVNRAMRIFRRELNKMTPRGLLFNSASRLHQNLYYPFQDSTIDQFLLQCYTYANAWNPLLRSNSVWYITPLYRGSACTILWGCNISQAKSLDTQGPLDWVRVGHDCKKLSVGIGSFGYVYKGQKRLCTSTGSTPPGYAKYQQCLGLLENGGTKYWDDACRVPYITGTALVAQGTPAWTGKFGVTSGMDYFATYENERSINEKVDWIVAKGLGGVMMYDLTMDLDSAKPRGRRNPLHRAVVNALQQ